MPGLNPFQALWPFGALWNRALAAQARLLNDAHARLERRLSEALGRQDEKLKATEHAVERAIDRLGAEVRTLGERQKTTRAGVRAVGDEQRALRLLVESGAGAKSGRRRGHGPSARASSFDVPIALESVQPPVDLDARPVEMLTLDRCPVCDGADRTLVCEFNRLILLEGISEPEAMKRYDYCLCHACGITYASRRPVGADYRRIFEAFEDTLGRTQTKADPSKRQVLLTALPLGADDRQQLDRRLQRGVFVSDHDKVPRKDYVPQLLTDRLANAPHIEILGSLLRLDRPRVLEIRPRFGSISAALKRLYDAEVHVLPMTDAQRFVIARAYGIVAPEALLDFDRFTLPIEGRFDLVVANHMFTHALRPAEFLGQMHRRLSPGGHLYLFNEGDDAEFLTEGVSMINTLNPFHVQTFDGPSLTRALAAAGFETVFITRHKGGLLALARALPEVPWTPMTAAERDTRAAAYARARDAAILRLPTRERWRFSAEWDALILRALAGGLVAFDDQARLKLVRHGIDRPH